MKEQAQHMRYYLPEDEPFFRKAMWLLSHKAKPVSDFPEDIQIQTVSGCNAQCIFCPNGNGSNKLPSGRMEWPLYKKIVDECIEHKVKRISPYLMNEPLLDRELGRKIRYIANHRKNNLSIKINSNGSLLDEDMAHALIDSGLDRLNISCHGISKKAYEASMKGLSLEKTLANVNRFLELRKKRRTSKPKVTVTMVKTKLIEQELPQIRAYWKNRKVSVHVRALENRSSPIITKKGIEPDTWDKFSWCKRLFTQAYILCNGDMILCCVDYGYTTILGNVRKQSIKEIWNAEKAVNIRRKFISGDTQGLLCHNCLKQQH